MAILLMLLGFIEVIVTSKKISDILKSGDIENNPQLKKMMMKQRIAYIVGAIGFVMMLFLKK